MQKGKLNVVTDAMYGSTGKGLMSSALAQKHRPGILTTTNAPNAGHSTTNDAGSKYVAKALPAAAILMRWLDNYEPNIFVGATAAFTIQQMLKEIELTGCGETLTIHDRAGVVTEEHAARERDAASGTKHLASTMQGCGALLADKVMRRQDLKLARDYEELKPFLLSVGYPTAKSMPEVLRYQLDSGETGLHEGAQGFSLDINHGHSFPHCTSRSTTATQNLADLGLPIKYMGDVYLVTRPYAIRVGHVVENGEKVGDSGGWYHDQHEITWDDVAKEAGAPPEIAQGELTTVTGRLRRVATCSEYQLREASLVNGATKLAFNFANYVDWAVFGTNDLERLTPKVWDKIKYFEDVMQIPCALVGTGPQLNHVIYLD